MGVKDRLYYEFVVKNTDIKRAYQDYVIANVEYHKKHRLKSWKYIMSLNKYYRHIHMEPETIILEPPKPPASIETTAVVETSSAVEIRAEVIPSINKKVEKKLKGKPYIKSTGSESASVKRATSYFFAKNLTSFDTISFNIFGTLLLSPFSKEDDFFLMVGEKLGYKNFVKLRNDAENAACNIKKACFGINTVNLKDIYQAFHNMTGLNTDRLMSEELDIIKKSILPNPYILRVCKLLFGQGKRIIATADTYLPREEVLQLLKNCGYDFITDVFISNEYGYTRQSGNIFLSIKNKYGGNDKVVHVGQEHAVDVVVAEKMGISSVYYPDVHEMGTMYRTIDISEPFSSAYRGVVNIHIHNGLQKYDMLYEYGFIYGGAYILGLCSWVRQQANKLGCDKIIFASSSSDYLRQFFQSLYPNYIVQTLYWSNELTLKFLMDTDRNAYLDNVVLKPAISRNNITIHALCYSLGLGELERFFKDENIYKESLVCNQNSQQLKLFFLKHWDFFENEHINEINFAKKYLDIACDEAKTLLVDADIYSDIAPFLSEYLNNILHKNTIPLLIASEENQFTKGKLTEDLLEREVYLSAVNYNSTLHKAMTRSRNVAKSLSLHDICCDIYEFHGFTEDGYFNFHPPIMENYSAYSKIRQGVSDFLALYCKLFREYPYLMNITAEDALAPFLSVANNNEYIKKFLSKVRA